MPEKQPDQGHHQGQQLKLLAVCWVCKLYTIEFDDWKYFHFDPGPKVSNTSWFSKSLSQHMNTDSRYCSTILGLNQNESRIRSVGRLLLKTWCKSLLSTDTNHCQIGLQGFYRANSGPNTSFKFVWCYLAARWHLNRGRTPEFRNERNTDHPDADSSRSSGIPQPIY